MFPKLLDTVISESTMKQKLIGKNKSATCKITGSMYRTFCRVKKNKVYSNINRSGLRECVILDKANVVKNMVNEFLNNLIGHKSIIWIIWREKV